MSDAVSSVTASRHSYDGSEAVRIAWDFTVRGGTFGEVEASTFVDACAEAVAAHLPVVTVTSSGGTRLQEGMRALVGIPRAVLALLDVAAAGRPHVSVAAHPTTGGVWVAVSSQADIRVGVAGATIGFSGPRVVEAMLGEPLPPGANTAASAEAAGLVDAVVAPEDVDAWVARALRVLGPGRAATTVPAGDPPVVEVPEWRGWDQVRHSRASARPSGRELVEALLDEPVPLRGRDDTVVAAAGTLAGTPAVVVALSGRREDRVTPDGYRLTARAAALAGRLDLPLVALVDSIGADPTPPSEQGGIAQAIADAMTAVITCPSPTIAVLHGEGGSGGALAAATTDLVGVTPTGWFAALGPEGASAALRRTPEEAAQLMRVAPADLLAEGFADEMAPGEPDALRTWLGVRLADLRRGEDAVRRKRRDARWRGPLPSAE